MQEAIHNSEEEIDMVGPHLLQEEIIKALESMKHGKAEGIDGIPVEMIKALGERRKTNQCKYINKSTQMVHGPLISCNRS